MSNPIENRSPRIVISGPQLIRPEYGRVIPNLPVRTSATIAAEFKRFGVGPVVLVEIEFDNQLSLIAGFDARFTTAYYEGRLVSIGEIRRVIQRNLGIYEVSSVEIVINDSDRVYSSIAEPWKGKRVTIKVGTTNLSHPDYMTVLRGKIDAYSIDEFRVSVIVKDSLLDLPEFPITGFVDAVKFPNALKKHRGLPLSVCYGTHSVTSDDDNRNRGAWPTLYVDNTTNAKKFLLARHAIKAINEVYTIRPTLGSTLLTSVTDYTAFPAGTINGVRMAYIQFTDAQFTSKVVDTGGVVGEVVANVQGKESTGIGTGTLLVNPIDVLKDFLASFCGNPSVDDDSMAVVREICDGRFYNVKGGYVDKTTTASVLAAFARSFNIALYTSKDGRVAAFLFDPSLYPPGTSPPLFDEGRDILRGSWAIDREAQIEGAEDAQLVNSVEFSFDYHWATRAFFGQKKATTPASVSTYGERSLVVDFPWNADSNGSNDVATRILFQFSMPVAHATFRTGLRAILSDLGDQIRINHANGASGQAWTDRRLQIQSIVFNPADFSAAIRGRDISPIIEGAYFLDDETRRERVSNGTVAVTNGSADINATGATSFITAGVAVGDIIRLKNPTNEGNRKHLKITDVVDADTVRTAQTVWVNESGISYDIIPSWITATTAQKEYGHLANNSTGKFSNGDAGFTLV